MLVAGLVLAALAAALHVYIFVLESVTWTSPRTRAVFGIASEQDARTMQSLAFNQGFYNLFLAVITALGIVLVGVADRTVGVTLVLAGTASMVAAGLVLVASDRTKASAAAKQAVLPAFAVVLVVLALLR